MANRPLLLRLYAGTLGVAGPAIAWGLLSWRRRKGKEMATRISERRGRASRVRPEGLLVWVHAASIGELNSILPLVEALVDRGSFFEMGRMFGRPVITGLARLDGLPVAILFNVFLDDFVEGITGGAFK